MAEAKLPPCLRGEHKWHFNGVLWVCRRGCGAWQPKGATPTNPLHPKGGG